MDKVGDLLIRIKNGYMASRKDVVITNSKLSVAIVELLVKEGYLEKMEKTETGILATLKYEDKKPVLNDVKRVSKPGHRVYEGHKGLPRVLNGMGIAIISTPKGVMTDKQARKEALGGEVMALVW